MSEFFITSCLWGDPRAAVAAGAVASSPLKIMRNGSMIADKSNFQMIFGADPLERKKQYYSLMINGLSF